MYSVNHKYYIIETLTFVAQLVVRVTFNHKAVGSSPIRGVASLAQLVERVTVNHKVVGSKPTRSVNYFN